MITQHFVRVRDGLASLREPALSSSRYSGGHGGCGARGVRVRPEGDEIAKGIAGGGERERDGRGAGGWLDPRVAAMLVVTVGGGVGDGSGGGFGSAMVTDGYRPPGLWITHADVTLRRYQDTEVRKAKETRRSDLRISARLIVIGTSIARCSSTTKRKILNQTDVESLTKTNRDILAASLISRLFLKSISMS